MTSELTWMPWRALSAAQFLHKGVRQTVRLAVTILLGSGVAFSQLSSTISLSNGIELNVTAKLGQPTGEETLNVEMARASGDSFYRMFRDQNKLVVFAYELFVGSLAGSDGFHVTAKLVGTEFAARFPNADGGNRSPPFPPITSWGLCVPENARRWVFSKFQAWDSRSSTPFR
jgi:hypothetical protein